MNTDTTRVLRWVYSQHNDTLACELQLADDGLSYQLTTTHGPEPSPRTLERFKDVTAAFDRQCELERSWIAAGWSLEFYDSQVRVTEAEAAVEPGSRG
jgi:hypothetical protein